MHGLMLNVRLVLRQLRRTPGFALTVVLTLALGIGATPPSFRSSKAYCCARFPSTILMVSSVSVTV